MPLRLAPRAIAAAILSQLEADPSFAVQSLPPQVAGPEFINLTLRPEVMAAEVGRWLADPPPLGVEQVAAHLVAPRWWWISPAPTSPRRCTWAICAPRSSALHHQVVSLPTA